MRPLTLYDRKAAPQVPDSGPAARKFLRFLPYSSGMVMHSRRSRRQVSSHQVSRSTASGAMMGISASVSPLAEMVSVPSYWPAATGASTRSASVTVRVTAACRPFSMRIGAACCSSGCTAAFCPSVTGTGCSGSGISAETRA